jgi:pyrroline-5-carboxylate reductase
MTRFFPDPSKNPTRLIRLCCYDRPMNFGVIGCGKMGSALIAGAVRSGALTPTEVWGYDAIAAATEDFCRQTQCHAAASLQELAQKCDTFLLATKPYQVRDVLSQLGQSLGAKPALLISVAAGIPLAVLEDCLPATVRVIRTMPNTPALVGKGASAYALGARSTSSDAEVASTLFSSVGLAIATPESLLDAVTGLSGSGPAYGFVIIEALADAGVRQGLPRNDAIQLAAQTLLGAAAMVLETGMHPAQLKDMVASPGGTTIAGIAALEQNSLRHALHEAVSAATQRSRELSHS